MFLFLQQRKNSVALCLGELLVYKDKKRKSQWHATTSTYLGQTSELSGGQSIWVVVSLRWLCSCNCWLVGCGSVESGGAVFLCMSLFHRPSVHILMVIAEVPKSRPTCTGTFQAFGHIIPADILLTKTSNVTEHKNQGVGIYTWLLPSEEFPVSGGNE